ncbi:MAG TPA: hypothetical protein VF403_04480 [Kofleriaceae bacterium]
MATTSRGIKTLITQYGTWTDEPKTGVSWLALARSLDYTWPPHDMFQLVLPALDLALRASQCDGEVLDSLDVYAGKLLVELDMPDPSPNPDITQLDAADTSPLVAFCDQQRVRHADRAAAADDDVSAIPAEW